MVGNKDVLLYIRENRTDRLTGLFTLRRWSASGITKYQSGLRPLWYFVQPKFFVPVKMLRIFFIGHKKPS